MIQMPRRSVTRFFIPLIDVLLLLFGIFLLMPIAREGELVEEQVRADEDAVAVQALEYELRRRDAELQKYERLKPELERVDKLKQEIEQLRKSNHQQLQERTFFRVIDVEPKTGGLFFYDMARPANPQVELPDEQAVKTLIERHRREAAGRDLYYYILYPRPETGYPTQGQERRYQAWFAGVPNSLREAR